MSRTVPKQKPGKSKQDYRTPPELLLAIENEFHVEDWVVDLAADPSTAIAINHNEDEMTGAPHRMPRAPFLGPGSELGENSLAVDWSQFLGDAWLNPPFADIEPWAEKCATTVRSGRIFLLTPASVGSNWYAAHVHGRAHVVAISPRVTFVDCPDPYPKDIVIAVFSGVRGGFSTWRWK